MKKLIPNNFNTYTLDIPNLKYQNGGNCADQKKLNELLSEIIKVYKKIQTIRC